MLLLIAFERWQEKGVIVSRNTCYSYRYSRPFHFSWLRINLSEKEICFHLRLRCPPNGSFKTPCQLNRIPGNQHPHKDLPLRGLEIFFFPRIMLSASLAFQYQPDRRVSQEQFAPGSLRRLGGSGVAAALAGAPQRPPERAGVAESPQPPDAELTACQRDTEPELGLRGGAPFCSRSNTWSHVSTFATQAPPKR